VTVSAGNTQVGVAGQALTDSLSVLVRDASSNPVSGVTVSFAVTGGGGSVSPASRATDASGIARTRFTLGAGAGTQTATATVSGLTAAQFTAVAQIQGAVTIANQTGAPLTDTTLATKTVSVLVTNQGGAPVPGVNVAWAATGGGSVSAPVMATNASGVSAVTFSYGATSGAATATATVTGLLGSPITVNLTGTAGNPTQLVKTTGDNGTTGPGGNATYVVTTRDSRGNPRSGVTINWAAASGGGSITPASNTTGATGTAQAVRTLGAATGAQTATATAPAMPASGPPVTFTTTAAAIITVDNNSFTPPSLTVPAGSNVTYQWNGLTALHNITFAPTAGAPANEPDRNQGSVQRTFNTVGTFNYTCGNHPGMGGSVMVTP